MKKWTYAFFESFCINVFIEIVRLIVFNNDSLKTAFENFYGGEMKDRTVIAFIITTVVCALTFRFMDYLLERKKKL